MLVDQSEHANFRPIRGQEIISDTHTDRQRINILSGPALRAAPAKTVHLFLNYPFHDFQSVGVYDPEL